MQKTTARPKTGIEEQWTCSRPDCFYPRSPLALDGQDLCAVHCAEEALARIASGARPRPANWEVLRAESERLGVKATRPVGILSGRLHGFPGSSVAAVYHRGVLAVAGRDQTFPRALGRVREITRARRIAAAPPPASLNLPKPIVDEG